MRETFDTPGPVTVALDVARGDIEVTVVDSRTTEVEVTGNRDALLVPQHHLDADPATEQRGEDGAGRRADADLDLPGVEALLSLERGERADHPGEPQHVRVGESEPVPEMEPEAVQALEDYWISIRYEKHVVADPGAECLTQRRLLFGGEELRDGSGQSVLLDAEVREAAGAARCCYGGKLVELAA